MFKDVQDAMIRFQEAAARHAIATIPRVDTEAGRLSRVAQIKGHLFDTTVLNRIMDFCVDSPCKPCGSSVCVWGGGGLGSVCQQGVTVQGVPT